MWWQKTEKVLFYLLLAYYAVSFTLFAYRFLIVAAYPYDLVSGEGMVYSETLRLIHGENIYTDINQRPYYISNYPPVFHAVTAAVMLITGRHTLMIGRLVSAASTLGVILLLFLIVKRLSKSKLAGLLAVLSFCSFWYIFDYAPYFRVDMLGLALCLCGLYWVQLFGDTNKVYLSVLFFIPAFFTKQVYIFAPLSAVIYLVLMEKKRAVILGSIFIAAMLLLTALGNFLTHGQFQKHLFLSFQGSFDYKRALDWLINFIRTYFAYIALSCYAAYLQIKKKEYSPYIPYLFLAVIPMLGVGRIGGYSNYYFEICLALSIFVGIAFGYILNSENNRAKAIVFFIICFQMNNLTAIDFKGENLVISRKPGWTLMPTSEDAANRKLISQTVDEIGGLAISETNDMYLLGSKNHEREYHCFLKYYIPQWNPSGFLKDLEGGRYNCIVTEDNYGSFSAGLTGFDNDKYRIIFRDFHLNKSIGKINIYERNRKFE